MERLKQAYDAVMKLSSKDGLKIGKYKLKTKLPLEVTISQPSSDVVNIDFTGEDKPKVEVKKIIKISINVLGITLGPEGGTVVLGSFPDVSFNYSENREMFSDKIIVDNSHFDHGA